MEDKLIPSRQDSLRGSITTEREWWDLTYYHLDIEVNPDKKYIQGSNTVGYKVLKSHQTMQIDLQEPMKITSGYRCPDHPIEAKKPQPGYHSKGAIDVAVSGEDAWTIIKIASSTGWGGIGVNTPSFIHLDRRTNKTVWKY